MSDILLATKIHIPTLRGTLVKRPHLIQRLNDENRPKLSPAPSSQLPLALARLLCLSEWITGGGIQGRCAWVSLDEGDNDVVRFWSYVIAALADA